MFESYIFDLYGTLVDISTDEENMDLWKAMSLLYQYNGAQYTKHELRQAYIIEVKKYNSTTEEIDIDDVFLRLFNNKGVEVSPITVKNIVQSFRAFSTKYIKLYPGVIEFLKHLKEQGKNVYLLSNAQASMTSPEIKLLGLNSFFDGICISSEVGYKKPGQEFYTALIDRYSINKEKAVMIGNDYESDIVGGYNAGLHTCYILSNLSPKQDRERADIRFAEFYFDSVNYKEIEKQLLVCR